MVPGVGARRGFCRVERYLRGEGCSCALRIGVWVWVLALVMM